MAELTDFVVEAVVPLVGSAAVDLFSRARCYPYTRSISWPESKIRGFRERQYILSDSVALVQTAAREQTRYGTNRLALVCVLCHTQDTMATLSLDTHELITGLTEAGIPTEQAIAISEAIRKLDLDHLTTKQDLEVAMATLKAELFKWSVPILLAQSALTATLVRLFG